MKQKIASVFMFVIGLGAALTFIFFESSLSIPLQLVTKITPTVMMLCWLVMKGIEKANWPIFVGLVFSMLCDVCMVFDDNNKLFLALGIGANMLGLVFYIVYYVRTDPSLDLVRLIPGAVILGVVYFVLFDYLGSFWLPVLVYCVIYAVFMWRSLARIGDQTISEASQWVCYIGSVILTTSDSLLSMLLFGVLPDKPQYGHVMMMLWWTGLLMLMITAEIKRQGMRRATIGA
jgi:hypothetical protein